MGIASQALYVAFELPGCSQAAGELGTVETSLSPQNSSLTALPPQAASTGRPSGVVSIVSGLMPRAASTVADMSGGVIGRSITCAPSLSVAPTTIPFLRPPPASMIEKALG